MLGRFFGRRAPEPDVDRDEYGRELRHGVPNPGRELKEGLFPPRRRPFRQKSRSAPEATRD